MAGKKNNASTTEDENVNENAETEENAESESDSNIIMIMYRGVEVPVERDSALHKSLQETIQSENAEVFSAVRNEFKRRLDSFVLETMMSLADEIENFDSNALSDIVYVTSLDESEMTYKDMEVGTKDAVEFTSILTHVKKVDIKQKARGLKEFVDTINVEDDSAKG